ncbi:MAG: hypothetical protein D3917_16660 [Candidatus Electrothrix sp. AX5]|nr:hypothetical protein [Candidatus Electrothrix sp. AX5]
MRLYEKQLNEDKGKQKSHNQCKKKKKEIAEDPTNPFFSVISIITRRVAPAITSNKATSMEEN